MSLLIEFIQLKIKEVLSEGQIENAKISLPDVVNKLKDKVKKVL